MSKGHMQDLQGFRTISSPSASPVDAYGGGVNAPKVSAADQLASAFGTVSKYGQRAAAQQQAGGARPDRGRHGEGRGDVARRHARVQPVAQQAHVRVQPGARLHLQDQAERGGRQVPAVDVPRGVSEAATRCASDSQKAH